jgi:hypothetical protein
MKKIKVICVNDSMELAFLPDASDYDITTEMNKIKAKYDERTKWDTIKPMIYVHIHEVELYEKS